MPKVVMMSEQDSAHAEEVAAIRKKNERTLQRMRNAIPELGCFPLLLCLVFFFFFSKQQK